jgi:hypothetical protein
MKNWLPFVSRPAFAMATTPRAYGTLTGSFGNS